MYRNYKTHLLFSVSLKYNKQLKKCMLCSEDILTFVTLSRKGFINVIFSLSSPSTFTDTLFTFLLLLLAG